MNSNVVLLYVDSRGVVEAADVFTEEKKSTYCCEEELELIIFY